MSSHLYTTYPRIPYTNPPLPLRTLDLHIPTALPSPSSSQPLSYTIIYIHGGAFRDPAVTSASLLPSLPHLFPASASSPTTTTSSHSHIAAIASLNYSLSPYPTHPTDPSTRGKDEGRDAKWPDYVKDVRAAINWLFSSEEEGGEERAKYPSCLSRNVIIVGHSVGATIAFALALNLDLDLDLLPSDDEDGKTFPAGVLLSSSRRRHDAITVKAIVGICGIYDFVALRDAHAEHKGVYEEFTSAAFGAEGDGGWERGNMVSAVRETRGMEGPQVVVLGQSKGDELVEWGQVEMMEGALRERGWGFREVDGATGEGEGGRRGKDVVVVELKGGHDEVWEKGEELAGCIMVAVEKCVESDSYRSS